MCHAVGASSGKWGRMAPGLVVQNTGFNRRFPKFKCQADKVLGLEQLVSELQASSKDWWCTGDSSFVMVIFDGDIGNDYPLVN